MSRQITKTVYSFKEMIAKFGESGKPTERARRWLIDSVTDHDWWEFIYGEWKNALELIGFSDAEISFRGFWSQGDGASFTCKRVDLEKLIPFLSAKTEPLPEGEAADTDEGTWKRWLARKAGGVAFDPTVRKLLRITNYIRDERIERIDSHYVHSNTCRFRADLNDKGDFDHSQPRDKYGWHPWKSRTPRVRKAFQSLVELAENLRQDLSRAIYKDLEEEYEYRTADEQLIEDAEANDWTFDECGRREG